MRAASLQSGSNGNCIYVQAAEVQLLFDAGLSGRATEQRLRELGRDVRQVQAVVLSHDHRDHVASAGVLHRRYGLPIIATGRTLAVAQRRVGLGALEDVRLFRSGHCIRVGEVTIETIRTPHDAADGVAFVVCAEGKRLGILTDLGHAFPALADLMETLDAAFLESNYDPDMLAHGPYPAWLRRRIAGPHGHLSNEESASLVQRGLGRRLRWICLAHLSEENNHPETALRAHQAVVGKRIHLAVASRHEAGELLEI